MFKIKSNKKEFITKIFNKYFLKSNEVTYSVVITDDNNLCEDDKVNIVVNNLDDENIETILKSIIVGQDLFINVKWNDLIKKLNVKEIEYFEALENEVYAVIGKNRFICMEKLYEIESKLHSYNYVRTSKSFLVNIVKINYIKPLLNYKLLLIMNNGDKIDVNRTYIKNFKKSIEL